MDVGNAFILTMPDIGIPGAEANTNAGAKADVKADLPDSAYGVTARPAQAEKTQETDGAGKNAPEVQTEKNAGGDKPKLPLPSEEAIKKQLSEINKRLFFINRQMSISIHQASHQKLVKIINTANNEVMREIPPEKTLDFYAAMMEQIGINYDRTN